MPNRRGVSQIDVKFDIDANGILKVSAKETLAGRCNQIQIRNDKGRLSKNEIDRMLSDANKFRAEDNKQRERVNAKNKLERYVFRLRDACDKELKWLDANQTGDKEEYEYRYNELSKKCSPKTASTNHLYVEID